MTRTQKQSGFTLAELLVVVVLITLLAGAAGAIYGSTVKKMAIEKSARELLVTANYARMIAVEEQRFCSLNLEQDKNGFFVSLSDIDKNSGQRKDTPVTNVYSKPVRLADGIRFESIRIGSINDSEYGTAERRAIWFNPDGTCGSAEIQIGDGEHHATISISSATGKGRLALEQADESDSDIVDLDFNE
jgi:type II secretion system protein H